MDVYRFVSTSGTNTHTIVSGDHYVVRGYYVANTNILASRFLHLYDGAPSGTPKWTITIPIESGANPSWQNGLHFPNGIGMALSTSPVSLVGVAANEITGFIVYDLVTF